MKKYIILGLLPLLYILGFLHGVNSDIVEKKIKKEGMAVRFYSFNSLVNNTFGVINIESIAKSKEEAEMDFFSQVSIAKFNRWTLIGDRKTEEFATGYRVWQPAMRFKD